MQVLTQTDEGFDNIAQTNTEWQKQRIFAEPECETSRLAFACILAWVFQACNRESCLVFGVWCFGRFAFGICENLT